MNEKSYTELMKLSAMNSSQEKKNFVQDLYIEILLLEIQLTTEKQKLVKKIDEALDQRDKQGFLSLSGQLNKLNKQFGT
ncbi:IDEAL domain-containing protein [Neobacillus sp. PS3-40]|uniref:IDEAL domain-containing protein n=1 Tax=Neobacillus sp. PS3-40 TaxID=3070679 RepID=UPI0027DFE25C|nr:IDEAL domain-containing protein [Neobacillus sp. PS3-40]WML43314.1 IDEAL domain-containing protein [Neobacillus sp. PS3-40]